MARQRKLLLKRFLSCFNVRNCLQSVFTVAMAPKIQSAARFQHSGTGRRAALEAAWLASEARSKVLEGMTDTERKRRRYK